MFNDWLTRRMMSAPAGGAEGWQEYPFECWGIGNISSSNHSWHSYANLLYDCFPVLSPSILVENNSSYNCELNFYTGNDHSGWISKVDATASGEYSVPSNALYFSATLWDRPNVSVVDSGLFKMYYKGAPYQKPVDKAIMSGSDFLWACGNLNNYGSLSVYNNKIVRVPRAIQTRTMDIDLTSCTYNIKFIWYNSALSSFGAKEYNAGTSATDILANYSTAMYYTIVLWDQPSFAYARTAPFQITFR